MNSRKLKVLFVCVHNSARSQMAEAWMNHLCPDFANASSAGLEPGTLNPLVVEAMKEIGIDISHHSTTGVMDLFKSGQKFDQVITVCDREAAERCPLFPGNTVRLAWSFADPSRFEGSWEERLEKTRAVRDEIKHQIEAWCARLCEPVAA
jgi:arsenate reductase